MEPKYRIALVEDNAVNRKDFEEKMAVFSNVGITWVCNNGEEFIEKTRGLPIEKLPDVVFMDLKMDVLSGPETIRIAKTHQNKMQFIAYTVFDDDAHIFDAIKAGAVGYLLKHESGQKIYDCLIETMENGGSGISPSIARKALEMLIKSDKEEVSDSLIERTLTPKEKQILELLVKGLDAKRIAEAIDSNTLTVRKHIANVYKKLHVNSKAQIISLANKEKWL
ncbi:MAG: response regulator transcription factor [Bacteroidia bacterium]|nr:response regulator transcription factor [Bacteroidia bacterium]